MQYITGLDGAYQLAQPAQHYTGQQKGQAVLASSVPVSSLLSPSNFVLAEPVVGKIIFLMCWL